MFAGDRPYQLPRPGNEFFEGRPGNAGRGKTAFKGAEERGPHHLDPDQTGSVGRRTPQCRYQLRHVPNTCRRRPLYQHLASPFVHLFRLITSSDRRFRVIQVPAYFPLPVETRLFSFSNFSRFQQKKRYVLKRKNKNGYTEKVPTQPL